jgi:NlpC/P60 family putative phage cell wall peptidase
MTTRAEIVAEAKTWIGTPWRHQQSTKGVGADCARGLIVGVARELGLPEAAAFETCPEFRGYGREPDPKMVLAACLRFLDPATELLPGNILYLRVPKVTQPMHFALVVDPGWMIHALLDREVMLQRMNDACRSRVVRIFSYRGIDG